jgi:hypothetical protein
MHPILRLIKYINCIILSKFFNLVNEIFIDGLGNGSSFSLSADEESVDVLWFRAL